MPDAFYYPCARTLFSTEPHDDAPAEDKQRYKKILALRDSILQDWYKTHLQFGGDLDSAAFAKKNLIGAYQKAVSHRWRAASEDVLQYYHEWADALKEAAQKETMNNVAM